MALYRGTLVHTMEARIDIQPLPYKKRRRTFLSLLVVFLVSLPFLYMYATGYRIDIKEPTSLVSTGGMYIAVPRTGAEIYIDGELVRETRTFRKAFYAQSLDAGTHRVHVQKDGYHTWVKELPISKRLVTEAEAFNLPLVPQVRVISEWQSATGTAIVRTPLLYASTTNEVLATTTIATTSFTKNDEYVSLVAYFATSTNDVETEERRLRNLFTQATTTTEDEKATTTIVSGGVRLSHAGEELYATWVGSFEEMPYYYCAEGFPPYSTTSTSTLADELDVQEPDTTPFVENSLVIHPVQTVPEDTTCEPTIRIDRKGQSIHDFDFYPGTTDFVILVLEDGVYVVEVDDRSWQNVQPLIMGDNLRMNIENGNIYVYDGFLMYQVLLQTE